MINTELKKIVDPNNECCCEHRLAHLCKEWAWIKGFAFRIERIGNNDINIQLIAFENGIVYFNEDFYPSTETEAVSRATEWILKTVSTDTKGEEDD